MLSGFHIDIANGLRYSFVPNRGVIKLRHSSGISKLPKVNGMDWHGFILGAFKRSEKNLRSYLRANGFTVEDQDDILHDAFLRVNEKAELFQRIQEQEEDEQLKKRIDAYIFLVVRNLAIDKVRYEQVRCKKDHQEFDEEMHYSKDATPEDMISALESVSIIRDAIMEMPRDTRVALLLKLLKQLSYNEIAEQLSELYDKSMSARTAQRRVKEAFDIIKKRLGPAK